MSFSVGHKNSVPIYKSVVWEKNPKQLYASRQSKQHKLINVH